MVPASLGNLLSKAFLSMEACGAVSRDEKIRLTLRVLKLGSRLGSEGLDLDATILGMSNPEP